MTLQVPTGCFIRERRVTRDIAAAAAVLCSKQQVKFTAAIKRGDTAELVRHAVVCPYCGNEAPAYRHKNNYARVPRSAVRAWSQTNADLELSLNAPFMSYEYCCPRCGKLTVIDDRMRRVDITRSSTAITLSCELLGIDELMALPWVPTELGFSELPDFEVLTFNLKNGRSYIKLGNIVRDVTEHSELLTGSLCREVVRNISVFRALRHAFEAVYGGALPYADHELGLKEYIRLTRFVGFKRPFYDAIPYLNCTEGIEDSFKKTVSRMHTADSALALFRSSRLPDVPSLRRLFAKKTELLFYLEECERLWDIISDINHYRTLLSFDRILHVLSTLRMRSGIYALIEDLCRERGIKATVFRLTNRWYNTREYGVLYASLSDIGRRAERKRWDKERTVFFDDPVDSPTFCVPMFTELPDIRDCEIEGFRFYWLHTSGDYQQAGRELRNCLGEWDCYKNPVVCVKEGDTTVAAIEVSGRSVVQARGESNCAVFHVKGLKYAIDKWIEINGLSDKRKYEPHIIY